MNIILDLDGTIALDGPRRPLIESHGWEEYFNHIHEDLPNPAVFEIAHGMYRANIALFIFTSRPEKYRKDTEFWLRRHGFPPVNEMHMRPEKDTNLGGGEWQTKRLDTDIKKEMIAKCGLTPDNTIMVLEDRDEMVEFYRELGFDCWQVHYEGRMFKGKDNG